MKQWLLAVGITALCVGCTRDLPLPDVEPIPPSTTEEMAAFTAPSLILPEPVLTPAIPTLAPRPSTNEKRYKWADGESYLVQVQVGYVTVVRLQGGEKITSIVDGDRAPVSEDEAPTTKTQPHQEKNPQCSGGVRWQFCRGVSESEYTPVESIAFTATHPGHRSGFMVFTTQRTYALDLQAVASTRVRLITFETPPPPSMPSTPRAPSLFPPAHIPHQYHIGYTMTSPGPLPEWAPVHILSDLPTASSAKIYVKFAPFVIHSRMPLLRGVTHDGKPYLLNSRQMGEWIIIDELAPRLELRLGAGKDAQRVVISRSDLRSITCPGDAQCPQWPATASTGGTRLP